jgi:hypothetical protein
MPSIDDIFSGNTLKSEDIKGREPKVTIKSVTPRAFNQNDGKIARKLVIGFENTSKVLVCNKVNAGRIAFAHGKDYSLWIGKQITLFVDPFVEFGGKIVPAIRVKPPVQEAPRSESPAPFADPDPMPPLDRNAGGDVPF